MQSAPEALKEEGNALRAQGRLEQAAERYRRALELDPRYAPALYNLGVVLQDTGRLADAEACFRRYVGLAPGDRDGPYRLGLVLAAQERFAEAIEAFRGALRADDANPLLWLELGRALRAQGRGSEAQAALADALTLEPRLAEAHNVLGMLAQDEGRLAEAIEHYRAATALQPDDAAYWNNLGCALGLHGRVDEAIGHLQRATGLRPDYLEAHQNLGSLQALQGDQAAALGSLRRALELEPANAAVAAELLYEMQRACDWSRFEALCAQRRRSIVAGLGTRTSPFSALSIPTSRSEQLACAAAFAAHEVAAARGAPRFEFRSRQGRLRVAYLSADFHEHATAWLTAELFELHDRARFDVRAYSYGPDDRSATRRRLVAAFEAFTDLRRHSHADAARAIHADGIDILVDLKGYTAHSRPGILALRPAPIQVSWLGYPGTMGAPFIDYLMSDAFVTPPAHAADYSEKLVLLPGSYQVNDRRREAEATPGREALGLPRDGFVFCSFNQPYKILPPVFDAWMRILAAVPRSVLWLLEFNRLAMDNLRREARARGIDPGRLVAAPPLPLAQHLGRLAAADLFLDTLPYNAHTSASDALWVGLPVLTCPGETFASRVAGSLLTAGGLPETIAGSLAEYEALAVRLARSPAELRALRDKLRRNRASCALFDTPAFARALETAYERMWARHLAGGAPEPIRVA